MKQRIFYSILIPNLGYSTYFFECLESIVNQNKNCNSFDYEIIVCDQSDKEIYEKIVLESKQRFGNAINFYHSDIKSLFKARHKLMSLAKGDYIVFIDSDDFISKDYILSINKEIETSECDVLIHEFTTVDSMGNFKFLNQFSDDIKDNVEAYAKFGYNINAVWNKTFKKALYNIKDYNQFDYTLGEDRAFSLPIVLKAKKIFFSKINTYYYRILNNSMSHCVSFQTAEKSIINFLYLNNKKMSSIEQEINIKYKLALYSSTVKDVFANKRKSKKGFYSFTKTIRKSLCYSKIKNGKHLSKRMKILFYFIKMHLFLFLYCIFFINNKREKNE